MPATLFEFFEVIAEELSSEPSRVITRKELQISDEEVPLLDNLEREMKAGSTQEAMSKAVEELREHFEGKGAMLPFDFDPATGRFTAMDGEFLEFIKEMHDIRSIGKRSPDFECTVAKRLGGRSTGTIHRVGHPRDTKKRKADFNAYLKTLGFDQPVLLGKDKDGGFDILWLLPIGTIPHRPIVSVQCKNAPFNIEEADKSVGSGSRSLGQHAGLIESVHVPCVLFNDYIHPQRLTKKKLNFVPLGLTDLAALVQRISVEFI
jgi:hypothetical protein